MTNNESDLVDRLRDFAVEYLTSFGDHQYEHPPICTEAADALASIRAERDAAVAALKQFLRCEYESADKYGLIDCIDNTGKPYQSAHLASVIASAEALVGDARAIAGEQKNDA